MRPHPHLPRHRLVKVLSGEPGQDLLPFPRLELGGPRLLPLLLKVDELCGVSVRQGTLRGGSRLTAHGGDFVAALFKLVLSVALALEDGRVDRVEDEVVFGSSKVEEPESVDVALVGWGEMDLWVRGVFDRTRR
mgnify:FL=1|jgi:hypothetical protein